MKSLEDIISDLGGEEVVKKHLSKTISIRIPVPNLAKIDALADLKSTSRNILLNDIIDVALNDLLTKLHDKNKKAAELLETKAQTLAQKLLEHEPPHPPHLRKKDKDIIESEE
jgi:hypothetical protein